jgi:hypothetical protein
VYVSVAFGESNESVGDIETYDLGNYDTVTDISDGLAGDLGCPVAQD